MSKIWKLLRCTRAVRCMLRNITWCILIDDTCFIVKCTTFKFLFCHSIVPAFSPMQLLANDREVLGGDKAVPRR